MEKTEEILKRIKEGLEQPSQEFLESKLITYYHLFQALFEDISGCVFHDIDTVSKNEAYLLLYHHFLDFVKFLKDNSIELSPSEMTDFVVHLVYELPKKYNVE